MPFRTRSNRFRRFKRKRVYRKKFTRMGRVSKYNKVMYTKRNGQNCYDYINGTGCSEIIANSAGTGTVFNLGFRLADLPNFGEFTALYDQYRIRGVKVSFIPVSNVSTFTDVIGNNQPVQTVSGTGSYSVRSYSAIDYNIDNVGLTLLDEIREYNNMRWKPYNRIHSRYVRPKIAVTTDQFLTMPGKQPWLPCENNGAFLVHFGLKFAVDPSPVPIGTILYKVESKYYLQFRQVK